jgi:hypothetical protein
MRHGLPGLLSDLTQSISIVKDIFHTAIHDGLGFTSIHTLGLAYTIVRHISYATRLLLMSSPCHHASGGRLLILLKLKQFENILHLGQFPLLNLPTSSSSSTATAIHSSFSIKKLQKIFSTTTMTTKQFNHLPQYHPPSPPSPPSTSTSTSATAPTTAPAAASLSTIEFEFSQSLSSSAVVIQNQPYHLLLEIESYLHSLSFSLAKDVHQNVIRDCQEISYVLSSKDQFTHRDQHNNSNSLQFLRKQILNVLGATSQHPRQVPIGNVVRGVIDKTGLCPPSCSALLFFFSFS